METRMIRARNLVSARHGAYYICKGTKATVVSVRLSKRPNNVGGVKSYIATFRKRK